MLGAIQVPCCCCSVHQNTVTLSIIMLADLQLPLVGVTVFIIVSSTKYSVLLTQSSHVRNVKFTGLG